MKHSPKPPGCTYYHANRHVIASNNCLLQIDFLAESLGAYPGSSLFSWRHPLDSPYFPWMPRSWIRRMRSRFVYMDGCVVCLRFNNSNSNFFSPIDDFTYWLLSCFYSCSTFGPTSSRTIWWRILLVDLLPLLSLSTLNNAPCFLVEILYGCSSFIWDEGWLN